MKNTQLFLTLLTVFIIAACSNSEPNSPEAQVKQALSELEEAIENRSLSQIMSKVSENYLDHHQQSKKDIARLMQLQLLKNQKIHLFTRLNSLEINNGIASIEFSAAMTSREVNLALEANRLKADTYRFSIVMIQEEDQWRVQSAHGERGW